MKIINITELCSVIIVQGVFRKEETPLTGIDTYSKVGLTA